MEVTVTGYARGYDEGAGLATALRKAADTIESAGGDPVRQRIRGSRPDTDSAGTRCATEYDITVSAHP